MADKKTGWERVYERLVDLYPPSFKERFRESMLQTFSDLYRDESSLRRLSSTFSTTLCEVIRERYQLIEERASMNSNLGLSAIGGLIFILPFILLNMSVVVAKGLQYDMRDAFDSFVLFGILWLGVTLILVILLPVFRSAHGHAGNHRQPEEGLLSSPGSSLIVSLLLATPFLILFSLLLAGIEPPFTRVLPEVNPDTPDILGTAIVMSTVVMAATAGVTARIPVVRTLRSGGSLFAHPFNLVFASTVVCFLCLFVGAITIDQFPCWIGVPNCD